MFPGVSFSVVHPQSLSALYNVILISQLKKCHSVPTDPVDSEALDLQSGLIFEEYPDFFSEGWVFTLSPHPCSCTSILGCVTCLGEYGLNLVQVLSFPSCLPKSRDEIFLRGGENCHDPKCKNMLNMLTTSLWVSLVHNKASCACEFCFKFNFVYVWFCAC